MHRDPSSQDRESIGIWVITFLVIGVLAWVAVSLFGGSEATALPSPENPGAQNLLTEGSRSAEADDGRSATASTPAPSLSSSTTRAPSASAPSTAPARTSVTVLAVPLSPSASDSTGLSVSAATTQTPSTTSAAPTTATTVASSTTTNVAPTTTTTTGSPGSCPEIASSAASDRLSSPTLVELPSSDPVCLAIAVSTRLHDSAELVLVADLSDLDSAGIAVQIAVEGSIPLLYYRPDSEEVLTRELNRLNPAEVWTMPDVPASVAPSGAQVVPISSALMELMAWLDSVQPEAVGGGPAAGEQSPADTALIRGNLGRWLVPFFWLWSQPSPGDQSGGTGASPPVRLLWLMGPASPASELIVEVAAAARGELLVRWDPADPSDLSRVGAVLGEHVRGVGEVVVLGDSLQSARWLVETTLAGKELPGGGSVLFPDRRLVAFYGAITTGVLGVLGEQNPERGLQRMGSYLEDYARDGIMTVPTFEIITTVAAADAGGDGNYSREFRVESLLPWVEFAAENGLYVVLDLQPGRTDFLTQARQYEELLKFPHVGVALDPEWRLGPNERHLVQIGSVRAEEANQVIEWLAGLVRREKLPQKLLIVHQFRLDMIHNREILQTPPELAVTIHMDGQGSLSAKYSTWNVLTAGAEEHNWWWGWKNFFDEDFPVARPEQVLALEPVVYFVSFQ